MCGIGGFMRMSGYSGQVHLNLLNKMGQSLFHRGPDAGSSYLDEDIALVHRRLSIIDLSDSGTQPMVSRSGRYVIVYNGEIYNYKALRKQLMDQGVVFKTNTDTEVLLALYEAEGERCLYHLNGMFAFAIWDCEHKRLFLARDRLGKKPLYVYSDGKNFAFASEMKAILKLPFMSAKVRRDAVKDYFFYQYVPDGKSIFQHVYKLNPGEYLILGEGSINRTTYWDVSFSNTLTGSIGDIKSELASLIEDSVQLRMVSDVPLGAFLSGGIDSSAVVGYMTRHSTDPVVTCSIGFDSERFDEVLYAREVAKQFQTNHQEYTVKESVTEHFTDIAAFFDEPFSDPSFIPTYYVSKLARKAVTVALAGDGGDENFAGYSKYSIDRMENSLRRLFPDTIRHRVLPAMLPSSRFTQSHLLRKVASLLGALARDPDEAFFVTNSFFSPSLWNYLVRQDFEQSISGYDPSNVTRYHYHNADTDDHLSRILYTDIKTYLPGDILVKVDRMSMANSLETRAPLLDYRLVEFAAKIPSTMKLHGREKKYILKESLKPMLSDDILYRKKMGFSVPLSHWLKNELRLAGEDYFYRENSGLSEIFDMDRLRGLWRVYLDGGDQHTHELWSLLMYEVWWQRYVGTPSTIPEREICA